MDPRYSAQDVLRCDQCQTDLVQSFCQLCHIKLCKACVGEHLSDTSRSHRVVPYTAKSSASNYLECPDHATKLCEFYCEKCKVSVCNTCIMSSKHHGHKIIGIQQNLSSETKQLEKNLKELEEKIGPQYEEIFSELKSEKANIGKHFEMLTRTVTNHGEDWHREIDTIVNKLKSDIDDMKNKHLADLIKQEKEITQNISEVKKNILEMKKILANKDISLISSYKPRNDEFIKLPPKLKTSLPSFPPQSISKEKIYQQFDSLRELSKVTEEHSYTLLNEPKLIKTIETLDKLRSVVCLSDEEVWTCGQTKLMKLHNLQRKLLKSIKTKSGEWPQDIALTRNRNLIYIDSTRRTVNKVKNEQIQEVIRLQEWKPNNICSSSSGDILVVMDSDDGKQSKVVRYSGYEEVQSIQFDDESKPLYSSYYLKHISENRNLDICVADCSARAVVVVSHAGKLRFRYTGHPSTASGSFNPYGITTDSQSLILTSDCEKNCIHILDKDGQFLRCINNCNLDRPRGLCVDSKDNLFAAELRSGKVKKIKYMKTL